MGCLNELSQASTQRRSRFNVAEKLTISCRIYVFNTAPGPVSNLTVGLKFTAVQISWGAPQMTNGVITQYEVTYRVSLTDPTDPATNFIIIPSLIPGTVVSDISVTAFTSPGRGVVSTTPDFTTPENPELRKCSVLQLIFGYINHKSPPSYGDQCPSGAAH